ncbi:uncharacterized protein LOC133440563 [Cololabis saira]|uniref:uncharacterized protein LOC133440563 n=1 Tax=Cololabis saira TaxID=129043 RepID=UPI002AD37266|nr:uncharacterized protein LOC133440563 [Cololabis saira]
MTSCWTLLCAAALALLVESAPSSSGGSNRGFSYDLSGQSLTDLYNKRVIRAERMERPKGSNPIAARPFSHTGVRVTLEDGSRWLIHKGDNYGIDSQTVVTDAAYMGSDWKTIQTRASCGRKTVADLVAAGGADYRLLRDNCHAASKRIMKLCAAAG